MRHAQIPIPAGFLFAGVRCGLKNKRNDIGVIVSDQPARAAGVFTQNIVRASSVDYSERAVRDGWLNGVVVNSGNANCLTGAPGVAATERMGMLAAEALQVPVGSVAVASTGVIGRPLDLVKVEVGIGALASDLGSDPRPFMEAILTTDLVEKWALGCSDGLFGPDAPVSGTSTGARILGLAKGSGMIAPNMATMLAFVVTDHSVGDFDFSAVVKRANSVSFNRLTVDGDTSTNDMVLVMANGRSEERVTEAEFERNLTAVMVSLAKQVARDGEGASKRLDITVVGTVDPARVARTIADSPLVKTAMFGCDPNWGRILMAAGRSGVAFDPSDAELRLAGHLVFRDGIAFPFDERVVSAALKAEVVAIDLVLGQGDSATVYACDLGYGYVRINAEYHT